MRAVKEKETSRRPYGKDKQMKIMATVPVRAAASLTVRQSRPVHYRITARKSPIRRFQHFIESTDWEGRYLCNRWIDKICFGGILASIIYFTPLLMSIIQE
jgi:hypothetical protein